MRGSHRGAIRRIRSDISKAVPLATREDGTFGAIFRKRLKDVAFVESGCVVTFECVVIGNPQPTIEWYFNESVVVEDNKHKISYENETPSPPGRPEVELSSDTEVFITWEAPQLSHSLECFTYKLEVRPAGENDYFSEWRLVSDKIEDQAAVVRHLTPQGIYQFRVIARNEFGWGAPSLTSRIIQTHPKNSPKLQIEELRSQYRVCVVSKPPKTQFVSKSKNLGEIAEEDEERMETSELPSKMQTEFITLNTTDDPQRRFQLIAPIPRGRFGEIIFALDSSRQHGADCVAKIKDINVEGSNGLIEFEAMKECQQENVVDLIAAYQKVNTLFLFMERCQEDIFERFTYRDQYNEEQASRVIAQIASALHWIHFRG
ncbi:unnamed protein product [Gongylonema pulchrum]|uniref:Protein kinase domain-containing protein n=1 Tax=Gongylonema pulchrum TaxID=637853 RepID=A0A183CXJ4_9BILA|nr:unnamed protein product [Gongylonema pulchrum]